MPDDSITERARASMRAINEAWLAGRVDEIGGFVHPGVVFSLPDLGVRVQGREAFLAGFRDFCENAKIHEYREHDQAVDVIGNTALVTFRYEMLYERSGERYRATGRDLWVFERQGDQWLAVWRTMPRMDESPA
jgi:ketosteroid isomerase-like protein